MNDRDLLELAAKAAGLTGARYDDWPGMDVRYGFDCAIYHPDVGYWNPLTDDGDALRLAVKLRMTVCVDNSMTDVEDCAEAHIGDPYAATRRAIVRAAAELGKAM